MKLKLLCLLSLLFLASCGSASGPSIGEASWDGQNYNEDFYACRTYSIVVQEVNYGDTGPVHEAVANWNTALGDDRFVVYDSPANADSPFHIPALQRSAIVIARDINQKFAGWTRRLTSYGPCSCDITVSYNGALDPLVIAHELGHCLGMKHTDPEDIYNVMRSLIVIGATITDEDVAIVKEHTNLNDPF
jgi:hypothetical protein